MMWNFTSPEKLHRSGVLGMNARNHAYIQRFNERARFPSVDNKLLTKILAQKSDIATPDLLASVRYQHDVKHLPRILANFERFVIKPAQGSGGRGIMVITGREETQYIKSSGAHISDRAIQRHVTNILSGLYSLNGVPDVAMIEQCIDFSDVFERFIYHGVPDVRIIVFQGYPVMAMMRLSTKKSDGKANLHQGAVGVGIALGSGKAVKAVQYDRPIEKHPDTGALLNELTVPMWHDYLKLATQCFEVTGLGYFGADIVYDAKHGPMLIELNARPGLAIQLANGMGMLPRLKWIEHHAQQPMPSVDQRVQLALDWFTQA